MGQNNMKVSISMVTYNHEKFIAQAIDSILMQEVDFEYEIVIGEDCSTDSTRQIVLDYQKRYPDKIRLLLPEVNLGAHTNAINTYKACKGQYIALLEGDDYWLSPDKLRKQVEFLDRNSEFVICFTNSLLFREDNPQQSTLFLSKQAEVSTIENLLVCNFISTPSVMYRNGIVRDFPAWYTEQGMGDWTLYILLAEHGKIGYIDEVMSAYRIHVGGVWSTKSRNYQLSETIRMLKSVGQYFGNENNQRYQNIIDSSIDYYCKQLSSLKLDILSNNLNETSRKNSTKLPNLPNNNKPYKLHIGCGKNIFEDWINIDIEANHPCVDLLCDIRDELPFEDESCSFIYNEHVLEHLTVEEGLFFLKECHRVLQPGGVLRVAMPDLKDVVDNYNSENFRDPDWLKWPEYQFIQTRAEAINISFRWWEHKWLYDREELNRRLSEAGFTISKAAEWGKSNVPELENRETRGESLLIVEAEIPMLQLKSTPLVSVCIPTYNGEKFIAEAIESVLAQTYPNLEIILSDDSSTDRTIEIAKCLEQNSSCKFSILEHSQYGLAQNWNFCISQAQGKYIKFLFQDDLLVPTAIEKMVALAEQDAEIGLVFSPRVLFTETGNSHDADILVNHEAKAVHKAWSNLKSIQSGLDLLQDSNILNNPINKVGEPSTVLIRKEVFDAVGFFNPEFCQLVDLEMWLRIMSQYKVGYIDRVLSKFRIHAQQQTQKNVLDRETIFLDYQRFFQTISSDFRYPQSTRQEALYRYAALKPQGADLQKLCKQLAEQLLNLSDSQLANWYQGLTGQTHKILLSSDIEYTKLAEEEQHFVNNLVTNLAKGFEQPQAIQTLLAAMLYYRADELPLQHDLAQIPDWLLSDYLQFLFSAPVNFQSLIEADNYYHYIQNWMDYLYKSILANPGEQFWQDITNKFARIANFIPTYFNDDNLKSIYVKRAEIIKLFLQNNRYEIEYQFETRPANRKKVRLGIIAAHFNPSAETFAALPLYEYLSRDFEIVLYSLQETNHPLEQYCRSSANSFVALPDSLSEQVTAIRGNDLDILFFVTNVTAVTNQMCLLASHRLARVQVTSGGSVVTTGITKMDYFLSGIFTDPSPLAQEQYQEELIQLPGAAHCFSYGDFEEKSNLKIGRQDLGIADDAVVFTSGANFYKITPELIHTWAKIIAAVPNSTIVLFPFGPNWSSSYPKQAFERHLYKIFAEYGVSADRVLALDPQPVPNREDLKEYFKLADIYLDSYPFAGTTSLIEPLQVNLPVIARQGNSFRSAMGSAMIRSLEIADLVADSEESYIQLAVSLGNNQELRQQKSDEIKAKMQDNPSFLDSKGYGSKIEKLFKELVARYSADRLNENLRLRDVNLMVFPDWSQPEESIGLELQQVIQTLATQPDAQNTTLLIDITNIDLEDAQMFISSIAMNLMMEEDLDITDELEISLIEDLSNIQWDSLLPKIDARIVLECDNQVAVEKLPHHNFARRQLDSFVLN
jgi:predicted O-linked N-acetylglucosamine transferase (SPINDLY family)/predicted SAM-dependent methyltransferase/GT2 family glycosyltransferase